MKFLWISIFSLGITSVCPGQEYTYDELVNQINGFKGKDRIPLLYELCRKEFPNDQELAQQRGLEILEIADRIQDSKAQSKGYKCVALAYHYTDRLDSARHYYELAASLSDEPMDRASALYNIHLIFQNFGEYDSAYYYLDQAAPLYQAHGKITDAADLEKSYGLLAVLQAKWDEATLFYMKADSLYQLAGDPAGQADGLKGLSYIYASQENYPATIEVLKRGLSLYEEVEDGFMAAENLNHIGYYFFHLGNLDSAIYYQEKSLSLARQVNNSHTAGSALQDLGSAYAEKGNYNQAWKYFSEAEVFYRSKGDPYKVVSLTLAKGDVARKSNKHREAIKIYEKGIVEAKKLEALDLLEFLYGGLSLSQEALGDYKSSLESYKSYNEVRDSTKSVEIKAEVNDLLIKYETLEKEKQLVEARASIDRKNFRNKLLLLGLIGLSCIFFLLLFLINERRKKERLRLLKEREIASLEREKAEQQLEFKQKELTAKILQLASKNEFLQSLEQEFDQLRSSVDQRVNHTTRKISRMIRRDGLDDDQWETFSKEFSAIHQSFLNKLQEIHGDFTKNEWRLITLMKMNLSAKEIANILRVTPEGVKKARYRMRKKMGLASDIDVQSYILGIST